MKTLKMTSVVNYSFHCLIALSLTFVFLSNQNLIMLLLLVIYLVYVFIHHLKLMIGILVLLSFYIFIYHLQHQKITTQNTNEHIVCTIYTIPKVLEDRRQFYCRDKTWKYLVYVNTETKLSIGDKIIMSNHLKRVKNNTVPNQFNYAHFLLGHQIAYQNEVTEIKVIKNNQLIFSSWINFLIQHYEKQRLAEYQLSFIIGNKNALSKEFINQTQMLNISHLFVVSGFHVAFLYLILKQIFKYCHITKERSQFIIWIVLFLFLGLNNFSVSIFRAVLLLIGIDLKRRYRFPIENIQLLSFIALMNIIINPFIFYQTGFILSYLITFVLFLSASFFKRKNHFILQLFKINLVAQLFSLPIVANFNFHYNFVSIILTPILGCFYSFIIFPLTLISLIFKSVNLYFFFYLYEILLSVLSEIKFFFINVGVFNSYRSLIYYFLLWNLMKRLEKQKSAYLSIILLIPIIFFYYSFTMIDEVSFIDVGQGDSIYIRSDLKRCRALIDTGGSFYHHPGKRVVTYLQSTQVRTLDVLFITHSDIDHAGDYKIIMDAFEIKTIIFNYYEDSLLYHEIKEYAKIKNSNVFKVKAYNKVDCGSLTFHILNPLEKNNTNNENSLVLFLTFNGDNYLFMGDATLNKKVYHYSYPIDYLKVSHHGSTYGTDFIFLQTNIIKTAIITVGTNHYGHPSQKLLREFEKQNITYYRTDYEGTISVKYYLRLKRMILYHPHKL